MSNYVHADYLTERQIRKIVFIINSLQATTSVAYGIMNSVLLLYGTEKLKISPQLAAAITGSFFSFNFILHFVGGWLSGRFITNRHLFVLGQLFQIAACFPLVVPTIGSLLLGLALFLTGIGLNVVCINNMIAYLFEGKEYEARCEKTFLWNYSALCVGFIIGTTLTGYYNNLQEYGMLFVLGGIGNLLAVICVFICWKNFDEVGTRIGEMKKIDRYKQLWKAYFIIFAICISLIYLIRYPDLSNLVLILFSGFIFSVIIYMTVSRKDIQEKKKMIAFVVLFIALLIYGILYIIGPLVLIYFTDKNVQLYIGSFRLAPQWFININSIILIFGGPIFGWFLENARKKGIKIFSIGFLFTLGIFITGLGFSILPIGIMFSDSNGLSSPLWLALSYTLQTLGELATAPIGYVMVGMLVPQRLQSFMMGAVMMSYGISSVIATYASQFILPLEEMNNPLTTNPIYLKAYIFITIFAFISALLLFVLLPWINKMTGENEYKRENDHAENNTVSTGL